MVQQFMRYPKKWQMYANTMQIVQNMQVINALK